MARSIWEILFANCLAIISRLALAWLMAAKELAVPDNSQFTAPH
ncbi:MAG: hypothetical protein AAGE59_29615 [Cyanobacteria bacterium P01_F01_bin.86]